MRNKLSIIVLVLLFIGMNIPQNTYAAPSTMDQVKAEKAKVNKKLQETDANIASVLSEMETLYNELSSIEADLVRLEAEIAEKEEQLQNYQAHFSSLSAEIGSLNEMIAQRNEILKARLSSYQEQGGDINFLEVIFGATSFNDFISRVTSINKITAADRELVEQQERDKEQIVDLQDEILAQIEEQEIVMEEVEQAHDLVQEKKESLKVKETSLADKQKTLQKEKASLEAENVTLSKKETEIANYLKEASKKDSGKAKESKASSKGNQASSKPSTSANGKLQVGQKLKVESTAYGPDCVGCSGITATGVNVKPYRGQKIIAVDPTVIPLGSTVYVPGYGTALAADVGGAIKGNRIDVLVESEKYAAKNWGRKHVTIEILSLP